MLTQARLTPFGSYAFAMLSLKLEDAHSNLSGVSDEHLKILDDWYDKLTAKYPTVGRVAPPPSYSAGGGGGGGGGGGPAPAAATPGS